MARYWLSTPDAAAKTGLIGLVRTLAWDAGPGVRVNLVCDTSTYSPSQFRDLMREPMFESIEGFNPEVGQAVLHIILSHHGSLEHGSPVVPATREATLVHMMDNLGGKLGSEVEKLGVRDSQSGFTKKREAWDWGVQREKEIEAEKTGRGVQFGQAAGRYLRDVSPKKKDAVGEAIGENVATPISRIKAPKGFQVELLYSVPGGEQGSWVSLCSDDKGRIYASDQYGGLRNDAGLDMVRLFAMILLIEVASLMGNYY